MRESAGLDDDIDEQNEKYGIVTGDAALESPDD
jgi:hypothetical protein